MYINTIKDLFSHFYETTKLDAIKLERIKSSHPEISWYPFKTYDKIKLLSHLTDYFAIKDITCLSDRPSILDIGTADGDLAFLFEMADCDVTAVDNSSSNYNDCQGVQAMKKLLNSEMNFLNIDIDYDFSITTQHDIIIFLDILYHLRNPMGVLINLCQAGEYMFVSTRICDEAKGVVFRNTPVAYLLAPFESAFNDPTNYWIFTVDGFSQILDRCGWKILNKIQFGYNGNDANPYDADKDKRIMCLCQRKQGYESLKYGHYLP